MFGIALGTALVVSATAFFALSLRRPDEAWRFVRRSFYLLLPWFLVSLGWFTSLGERGLLDVSQALWMSAVILLVAELLGLSVSTFVSRAFRHGG